MKRFLLGSVGLVALMTAGSANAADLPVYKAPPPVMPVWNWTGCYIGGHVGYHRSSYDQHLSFDDVPPASPTEWHFTDSLLTKGFDGGGQIGCNVQTGTYVWGVEADYSGLSGSDDRFYTPDFTEPGDSVAFSAKTKSLWSVRGRFGVAADRAFIYGTAGWAQARFNYTYALNDTGLLSSGSLDFTTDGLVVGVGAEYALWSNIVVGAEYLHYAFGTDKLLPSVQEVGPWGAAGDHINLKTVDVVRLRASYLFNFGGGSY
jgi:outer membrane immunogenic protein